MNKTQRKGTTTEPWQSMQNPLPIIKQGTQQQQGQGPGQDLRGVREASNCPCEREEEEEEGEDGEEWQFTRRKITLLSFIEQRNLDFCF